MELGGIQNQHPQKKNSLDTKVRSFLENSCSILSFFKLVMIFNNTSADLVLISVDVFIENYHNFERTEDRATVFLK